MAGFEVSTEALRPMPLRCLLGSCALGSGDAATGELEEDARLTALFLWTLQSTEVPENNGKKEENDQEEVAKVAAKGFSLLDAMLLAVPRRGEREMTAKDTDAMAAIEAMVHRIVEKFDPLKIILFGSYARGVATSDSDVDLLVVMPIAGSKRRQATDIDMALADRRLPLDLIVITPEEFAAYKDVVGPIVYPAVREGKVLHERAA